MQSNLNKDGKSLSLLSRTKDNLLAVLLWKDTFLPQTVLNYLGLICQKTGFFQREKVFQMSALTFVFILRTYYLLVYSLRSLPTQDEPRLYIYSRNPDIKYLFLVTA